MRVFMNGCVVVMNKTWDCQSIETELSHTTKSVCSSDSECTKLTETPALDRVKDRYGAISEQMVT